MFDNKIKQKKDLLKNFWKSCGNVLIVLKPYALIKMIMMEIIYNED